MKTLISLFALLFSLTSFACDITELRNILKENVSSTLSCLGEGTANLINIVQSDGSGETTIAAIEEYIKQNDVSVDPKILNAMKALSELNHLIAGDAKGSLKQSTVAEMIELLKILNSEFAQNISPIMGSEQESTLQLHQIHRGRVRDAANKIMVALLKNFENVGDVRQVNIDEVINSLVGGEVDLKKALILKKLFAGGSKTDLTSKELSSLIYNFPHAMTTALDIVRYEHLLLNQKTEVALIRNIIQTLEGIIFGRQNRDSDYMISISEVMSFVPNLSKVKNLVVEAKKIFGGGNDSAVYGGELKKILGHADKMLTGAFVSHLIYDKYRGPIESTGLPVEMSAADVIRIFPEYEQEVRIIVRIINNGRFMKGEFEAPFFTHHIRRNADAVAEVYMTEYVLNEVLKNYPQPGAVEKLVTKFQSELIELGVFLPQSALQFADYVSLMARDLPGFVTFFRAGEEVGTEVFKVISKKCIEDEFGRLDSECLKKSFIPTLCENYGPQFALLCKENDAAYLTSMTKVARTCQNYTNGSNEEIPFSKADVARLSSSIMHVEALIIKNDKNKDNVLNGDEVKNLYQELSPLVDIFVAEKPSLKKYKEKIFTYVLKYGKYPNVETTGGMARLIKYLISFTSKPSATRKSLAAFFAETRVLLEQLRTADNSGFDCNYLRDPEHIPQEI